MTDSPILRGMATPHLPEWILNPFLLTKRPDPVLPWRDVHRGQSRGRQLRQARLCDPPYFIFHFSLRIFDFHILCAFFCHLLDSEVYFGVFFWEMSPRVARVHASQH